MKIFLPPILTLLIVTGCSLGPNPNPGERTVDIAIGKKEYSKAVTRINTKIEKDYTWAELRLALLFEEGLGVERSIPEAIYFYKIVAKKWGNDPWSRGDMYGSPMFGNSGFYNQNRNALFAQYKLAKFYHEGIVVEKDLIKSYLLLKNIFKMSKEIYEFKGVYCCTYLGYEQATSATLAKLLTTVEEAMTHEQKEKANAKFAKWSPQNDLD